MFDIRNDMLNKGLIVKLNLDFRMAVDTVLFLQKRKSDDYIQAEKIADALGLSLGYLQKVLQTLSKYGIVQSKRGRIGGVKLGRKTVTLLDLWNVSCGEIDAANPPIPALKKPLKAFANEMKKVVICKKK